MTDACRNNLTWTNKKQIEALLHKLIIMDIPIKFVKLQVLLIETEFEVEGAISIKKDIMVRVPQGSLLNPLLFLLCTNDIQKHQDK